MNIEALVADMADEAIDQAEDDLDLARSILLDNVIQIMGRIAELTDPDADTVSIAEEILEKVKG